MNPSQWTQFTRSQFPREQRALDFLAEELPDWKPFHLWSNFEFYSLNGAFHDVDALVFAQRGVFLVELETRAGRLAITDRTWVHTHQNGTETSFDTPLALAREKAILLRELLQRQLKNAQIPPIQPVIFLTEPELETSVFGGGARHLAVHPDSSTNLPSILNALYDGSAEGLRPLENDLNTDALNRFTQAIEDAGVAASLDKYRTVGNYVLKEVIDSGAFTQDFIAEPKSKKQKTRRRARVYNIPVNASKDVTARIQNAAEREYKILDQLRHPNILLVREQILHETRPAVLFEDPKGAVRLDHYLTLENPLLDTRLRILRDVAEAVRYAHDQRVNHRAIAPQSVLVVPHDDRAPSVFVYNWQTSSKEGSETGTQHVADYTVDPVRAYLAPELSNPTNADDRVDVFGLGALGHFLVTGLPPAETLDDTVRRLMSAGGFRPSLVADGIHGDLDNLIYKATRTQPRDRFNSIDEFLERLEEVTRSLEASPSHAESDPLEASPGDLIGGYEFKRRLGSGATATAFLAFRNKDGQKCVLKVANEADNEARLTAEAEALRKLDHPLIVDCYDLITLGGRRALVLQNAGESLRAALRDGALSLDDLRTYGTDLLQIVAGLEGAGVLHRDIKPANLGVGEGKPRRQLMLFDFSLASVDVHKIEVGTPLYRDPFLFRPGRRWDEYGDRWSAAITLYEMVTSRIPEWMGDVQSPHLEQDPEILLEPDRFPASVRDALFDFFYKAFQPELADRFDNAKDMLDAWRRAFAATTHTEHGDDDLLARVQTKNLESKIVELGLSPVANDALDRLNVISVRDLLAINPQKLQFQKGLTNAVRKELTDLRQAFEEIYPSAGADQSETHIDPEKYSVDQLVDHISETDSNQASEERRFITDIFGQHFVADALPWPSLNELATRHADKVTYEDLQQRLETYREHWSRKRVLQPLRDQLLGFVESAEGLASDRELARAVLGNRGSTETDPAKRLALASVAARAAVEAELAGEQPRFHLFRLDKGATFVVRYHALDETLPVIAEAASEIADGLVKSEKVVSEARAIRRLEEACEDQHVASLSGRRLLAVATELEPRIALSSRNELYPAKMSAEKALRLSASVLTTSTILTEPDLRARVRARYPEAQSLPERPALDQLMQAAGLPFEWKETTTSQGKSRHYVNTELDESLRLTATSLASRGHLTTALPSERASRREQFHERLTKQRKSGGFLTLLAGPEDYLAASSEIAERYDLEVVSVERALIEVLREEAEKSNTPWDQIVAVDSDDANPVHRAKLFDFIRTAVVSRVTEELMSREAPTLFTDLGLLGRWEKAGTMRILEEAREKAGSRGGPKALWFMLASDEAHELPTVEGQAVPVIDSSEYARLPRS